MKSQTFQIFEMIVTKAMMPEHRFFVLARKRTKIERLAFPNVKISVLFKRNSCFSTDKKTQRSSEVDMRSVLSQLANADQDMNENDQEKKTVGKCHTTFDPIFVQK